MKLLFYVLFFCISVLSFSSNAQVSMSDEEMDKVIDSLLYNQPQSELSVFLQYQNRTYFSGRDLGVKQWNSTLGISYTHKSGLSFDAGAFAYSKSDPMVQMLYTSIGYSRDFGENLTIGLEQGRMIETKPEIGFSNPLANWSGLSVGYSFGKLYSTLDYTLLWGSDNTSRLRLGLSYSLLYHKSSSGFRLSITPKVLSSLGTQAVTYSQYWDSSVNSSTDSTGATNVYYVVNKQGKKVLLKNLNSNIFGLMALDFSCRLTGSYKRYRLDIVPHVLKPFKLYPGESVSTGLKFFVSMGLYYSIKY